MDDLNNYNNSDNNSQSDNSTDNNGYNNGYGNPNPFNNGNQYNGQNNGYINGNQYNNQNNGYNNGNPYNNGYNGNNPFTGNYNGYPQNMYNNNDGMPEQKGAGFAIASFVISLVNFVLCCTVLSVVTVPICLIFSIVSLVGKRKGKGFAIAGIIISVISGIFFAYYGYIFYKVGPDFIYFAENSTQIIEEYDRDGTIPERFEKYRDPKYDKYWDRMGYDSFDEFFDRFIKDQKRKNESGVTYDYERKNGTLYVSEGLLTTA